MAILNGILGGIAGFFQNQATSSVYPVSPISGQSKALAGVNALKAGGSQGISNALNKLADYAIKRAEQMNPVIVVGSGRVVDVVFKKGFDLSPVEEPSPSSQTPTDPPSEESYSHYGNNTDQRQQGYTQGEESLTALAMKGEM